MKRKRITVMWMRVMDSPARMLSLSPTLLYFFSGMLVFAWVVLALGGYLGKRLYSDYIELKEKNYYLLQKERELETLHQVMERIRMEENTLRDYLGLEKGGK